jgi:hypothetical protein
MNMAFWSTPVTDRIWQRQSISIVKAYRQRPATLLERRCQLPKLDVPRGRKHGCAGIAQSTPTCSSISDG